MHPSTAASSGETPEITIESIGNFLKARGWRMITELCFEDPTGVLGGFLFWTAALEVQIQRDHKAAAAQKASTLEAVAGGAR